MENKMINMDYYLKENILKFKINKFKYLNKNNIMEVLFQDKNMDQVCLFPKIISTWVNGNLINLMEKDNQEIKFPVIKVSLKME